MLRKKKINKSQYVNIHNNVKKLNKNVKQYHYNPVVKKLKFKKKKK